ncbi:MAG: glycoside hydrolase family 31 protein [Bacteroidales bacterium]|nr:glycoside hydrolase family 31 protein [Bacteroidales bacterium]
MKSLITTLIILCSMTYLSAQKQLNTSLGDLSVHEWDGTTLNLLANNGKVRITFYTESIVRVRIVNGDFARDFSYAVSMQPEKVKVKFTENRGFLQLESPSLKVFIQRNPVRISFYNAEGELLNEDDQAFGTSWIGDQVTTYKTLKPDEKFIGLGAKTGNLNRFGSGYVNWNTDNPHYENYSDPLYTSIPFYIGIHRHLVYGIFFDNSWRTQFNFGASNNRFSFFSADGGEMDYYFIHGKDVASVVSNYTGLTGRMTLPPLWSLGYQQCRWSYTPDTDVLNVAKTFREKRIPADVIYLDIDHMDNYKIFTWHPQSFSKPDAMMKQLQDMNFHTTIIVDPGIKVEKGYHAYEDGLKNGMFAMYPDGSPFTAQVWPGWCHFPDFTKESARSWWGEQFRDYVSKGVTGFWNDMNEIATWGQLVPPLVTFDWDGSPTSYQEAKNMYGMQMARSTFEGTRKLLNGKRPFILTRAGFAGLQRYTALWTGDNQAHDDHMLLGIRLVNSLGLSGVAFAGYDAGGFGGNATPELYARWMSIAAFSPFYRGHTAINTNRSEPWSYGEKAEHITRNYISFRYSLMPYIYAAFLEANQSGLPVQRSLALDYFTDERIFEAEFSNQYLFGPSLLIVPATSEQLGIKAYLPDGKWFDLYDDKQYAGKQEIMHPSPLNRLPVFVKAGSIIPLQSVIQFTSEKPNDTLEIHVYAGPAASLFNWYEDDGTTYAFEKGEFYQRRIDYSPAENGLSLTKAEGSFKSRYSVLRFVLHGFESDMTKLVANGKRLSPVKPKTTYLQTITREMNNSSTIQFIVNNTDNQININW